MGTPHISETIGDGHSVWLGSWHVYGRYNGNTLTRLRNLVVYKGKVLLTVEGEKRGISGELDEENKREKIGKEGVASKYGKGLASFNLIILPLLNTLRHEGLD
ncbi:hypothetical protein C8F04DRAFT_1192928 [Mycena alexandri]|uniref:Uncharacterized protein n=1 Tax=Mycena alexandri TaxID=1745969 RepID=A0AAD6WR26_9AGAR|nr:hypothetical protein C8F04DRAFT_1192928 [Mycena alexandri]